MLKPHNCKDGAQNNPSFQNRQTCIRFTMRFFLFSENISAIYHLQCNSFCKTFLTHMHVVKVVQD